MSIFLRQIARYVAKKAASDPQAREKMVKTARLAVDEVRQVAREKDKAYAAGKAFRRAFEKFQNDR